MLNVPETSLNLPQWNESERMSFQSKQLKPGKHGGTLLDYTKRISKKLEADKKKTNKLFKLRMLN